ncbi:forkhead-associated domain-containing protein / FHA domain-containing protein [Artemisia annua]|uniref:Forkhead-associated domain-containing protein / FHA domain-containing protein n=1 Tax=Artemisia annua TaxID=35608 RepID=A0A2U1Q1M6_ARTAN|nr:forkhead-associated domain-containing protein / FHA domain-containing protein [Artemisia annua]
MGCTNLSDGPSKFRIYIVSCMTGYMNKRSLQSLNSQSSQSKKPKHNTSITASLHIKCFGSKNPIEFIDLEPRKPYTIGRDSGRCDYVFEHPQVSKTHCQLYFDDYNKKVYISDGVRVRVRVSLNGVFVDGIRVGNGESKELRAGSEVSVVCGSCFRVGFVVEKIVFSDSKLAYAGLLSRKCREILSSDDPVLYIRKCFGNTVRCGSRNRVKSNSRFPPDNCIDLELNAELLRCNVNGGNLEQSVNVDDRVPLRECNSSEKRSDKYTCEENVVQSDQVLRPRKRGVCVPPPGSKFYLNRLHFMDDGQSGSDEVNVTLPELLYPVETLERVFIATFTSDLSWFLSYCEIPAHLPIAVACHNAERCWSSSPEQRTLRPYSDFPNLVVIYPQFPETISFGNERKKFGIACHHPKLFVLQRDDSIRVIITSANLVAKQWLRVTNTVWWQDFPRGSVPDYTSLFAQSSTEEVNLNSKSDFAAQLAGFMATLLVGAPDQAQWILELAKFDFSNAAGHLVASVPGIYSPKHQYISEPQHTLSGDCCTPQPLRPMLLGSVDASVVGISHLYRTSVDSNGALLKRLAGVLGNIYANAYGLLEVILRRNVNIAADANAVSIAVSESQESPGRGCIQLGFLPRDVAKWVAPLSDAGWFAFSAYIYPKEVLACAIEGSNNKAHLILYVYQGPNYLNISKSGSPALASAMCSLVASIQRCSGLWRLHEILGHYKWPEHWETDFTFGSSSVGAVNTPFLAAFSAATGKRSSQFTESEESDPDWGCWSASQELRNPSIKIIFPTIERVKTATCGIFASKYILCFSQKTWLRLKHLSILHDAVPRSAGRVGHPMHVKVARRRFQSRTNASSFGWVYCGSHNFSAAAWGRPLHNSLNSQSNGVARSKSVLGSRLHICNYEFGIVFIVPPSERTYFNDNIHSDLDDIVLPFVVPAPRYRSVDIPATKFAMSRAYAELAYQEREKRVEVMNDEEELMDEEEELLEVPDTVVEEKEDEKAYAEKLWGSS